jgi:hypothetical protein
MKKKRRRGRRGRSGRRGRGIERGRRRGGALTQHPPLHISTDGDFAWGKDAGA